MHNVLQDPDAHDLLRKINETLDAINTTMIAMNKTVQATFELVKSKK